MISLNFLVSHVVHIVIVVTLAAVIPLYRITVENPVADSDCQAQSKYHVQCGLFQGRAINFEDETVCTGTCSDILHRVNTGKCQPIDAQQSPCTAWLAIDDDVLTYTDQATAFAISMIVLSAVGMCGLLGCYVDPGRAPAYMSTAAFLNLISVALGAGFIYSVASAADLGELKYNEDAGQSVTLEVPTPLIAMLPITELLLLQGVHIFKSSKL